MKLHDFNKRPCAFLLAVVAWIPPAHADDSLWQKIKLADHFAILRHALAPGFGDPGDLRIGDCATQRNLDDTGRERARRIGERFRGAGSAEPIELSAYIPMTTK